MKPWKQVKLLKKYYGKQQSFPEEDAVLVSSPENMMQQRKEYTYNDSHKQSTSELVLTLDDYNESESAMDVSTFDINRNVNNYNTSLMTIVGKDQANNTNSKSSKGMYNNDITTSSYYAHHEDKKHKLDTNKSDSMKQIPPSQNDPISTTDSSAVEDGSVSDLDLNKIKLPKHFNYNELSSDSG